MANMANVDAYRLDDHLPSTDTGHYHYLLNKFIESICSKQQAKTDPKVPKY